MNTLNTSPTRTWRSWCYMLLATLAILLFAPASEAQVNYSFNFDANSTGWTGNFTRFTGATTCGGAGGAMRKNLYGSVPTGQLVSPLTGTSQGGSTTITYDYKAMVWSANTTAQNPWGSFNVQYGPSTSGPWTTIANISQETQVSGTCLAKSHTFTPPAGALYIRFDATRTTGDYYLNYDNITVVETVVPCAGTPTPGNTQATVTNGCGTLTSSVLSLSGTTAGAGVTYQWQRGPAGGGGPWTSFGAGLSTQSVGPLSASESFQCIVVCTNSGQNQTSTPITLTVGTNPTVGVGASPTGPFCAGDQSTLTATGADAYTWAPATDLSAASGNPVTFTAAGTTRTYTVTGTTAGCSSTATVTMTVNTTPVVNSVTASPNPICANGSSQLEVNASDPATASVTGYAFTATTGALDPMAGATDLGVSGDDAQSAITNIGFDFYYEAVAYTTFSANSNGSARLDGAVGDVFPAYSNTSAFLSSTLHPLWDDHSANSISTVLVGSSPNRIRIINLDLNISFGNQGTMQIWLYEGSNVIEYRYAASTGIPGSSTIALAGANPANFMSITPPSSSSTVTRNDAVNTWPGTNTVYRFTPPASSLSAVWTPATYLDSDVITNPLASNVAATQAYTVTVSNGTCSAQGNVTVTVNPAISGVTLTPAAPRYCSGGSVLLTAAPIDGGGPFLYQWTDPNSAAAGTNPTQIANIPGLWSVEITDACLGSPASNSVTVTEDPTPTAAALAGPACLGQSLQLTGQTSADPGATFAWTGPNSFSSTDQDPIIGGITAAAAGTYSFTVTSAAPASCVSAQSTVAVTINTPPTITAAASATPNPICAGGSTQLSVSATAPGYIMGAGGATFTDISGTGAVIPAPAIGDDTEHPLTIPSFTYNGVAYTDVTVGANGAIIFGSTTGAVNNGNVALPASFGSSPIGLAPFWDDLDNLAGTQIYTQQIGNLFIIQWEQWGHFSHTTLGDDITFQIQLNLVSGAIYFVYDDVTFGGTQAANDAGASATIGIGLSATEAVQYSFNTANLTAGQVISFTPAAAIYSWDPAGLLDDATISNPLASNVFATTDFTVTATNAGCSVQSTVQVQVDPPPAATATLAPDCGNDQFSVNVEITSTGTASTAGLSWTVNGSPGAGSPLLSLPVSATPVPLGPFAATDEVEITLLHETNSACDQNLGRFLSGCPIVLTCGTTINTTFCYENNESRTFKYANPNPGQTVTFTLTAGTLEDFVDQIRFYDGPSNLSPSLGAFTGTVSSPFIVITSQDTLFVEFDANGSNSCDDGAYSGNPLVWSVQCTPEDCTAPSGSVDPPVVDCVNGTFTLPVLIFDPGMTLGVPESVVNIISQVGANQPDTLFNVPPFNFPTDEIGPFPLGSTVNITLMHVGDQQCNTVLTPVTAGWALCPNDEPCDARPVPVNPDYTCVETRPGNLANATATTGITNTCGGNPTSDLWYSFVTTGNVHRIQLQNVSPATGMTIAAFRTPCGAPVPVDFGCSTNGTLQLIGLTPGETILLRVYNTAGGASSTTFNVCVSAPPAGYIGQNSLHFDGTNDRVNCGTSPSISITGSAITLEAWIYPTSFRTSAFQGSIINKEGPNLGYALRCGGTGQLSFAVGNGSSIVEVLSPTNALTLFTWQHVAATYDGTTKRIYVNGVEVGNAAGPSTLANTPNQLMIGDYSQTPGTRNFPGRIDEVRIWNTVLSQATIAANQNAQYCGGEAGLQAYYQFDQGIDGGNNAGVTTLFDISGNANNGSLNGFALVGATSNWRQGKTDMTPCPPCTGTPNAGAITGLASVCSDVAHSLNIQGQTTGTGISYQWYYGPVGNPTQNLLGTGLGQSTASIPAGSWELVVDVTCDEGPSTVQTAAFAFSKVQTPTVTPTSNAPICAGDDLILTGTTDAGSVFSWAGPNSFSSTEQNPTITAATTAANGTYTLTVTNGACVSNGTTAVLVDTAPVVNSFTYAPAPACQDGTADLTIDVGPFTSSYSGTASSGAISVAIPDDTPSGVSSILALSGTGATVDAGTAVSVNLNITHTWDSDLNLHLVGPGDCGSLELTTGNGGSGDNYTGTTLTLGASPNVTAGVAPFTGVFGTEGTSLTTPPVIGTSPVPATPLAGCPVDGSWRLFIRDGAGGDTGTLTSWGVTISGGITVTGNYSTVFGGTNVGAASYTGPNNHIATGTIDPVLVGTNNYTALVSGPNGCTTSANIDVIGAPAIQLNDPTIAPLAPFFCGTGSVTLTATPNGGGAPYSYVWDSPTTTGVGTDPSIDADEDGVWTVTITDGCGGTGVATVNVTGQPEPTASIAFSSVCIGESLVLNATSDAATFSWSGPNGFSSTELAPVVTASAATSDAGTYVLDVDLNGCTNQASIDVEVGTTFPTVAFSAVDNPACEGTSTDLIAVAGPLTNSYSASVSSGAISVAIPDNTTTGVSSVLAVTGTGATVSAGTAVSVNLNITHTWDSDLNLHLVGPGDCGSLELTTGNGGSGDNYTGTTLTLGASPNVTAGVAPFTGVFGTEGTSLTTPPVIGTSPVPATPLAGCPVDGSWRLFIRDGAGGDTGTLTSWGLSLSGSAPLVGNYSTVFSGGTVGAPSYSGTNNETATATEPSVPSGSTIYTAVVTSPNGCSTTEQLTLVGNPALALNDPIITPAAPALCGTETATLTADPNGGGAPYSYSWSGPGAASGGTDPTLEADAGGLWTVTITDNCGGTGVASVSVTAEPQPTATASATPGCVGQDLTLTGTTDIGTIYSWSGPNSFSSTDLNPAPIVGVTSANGGTYTLTVESPAGCTNTATVAVDVFDPPVISSVTAVPTTLCEGGNSQLNVVDNAAGYALQTIPFAPVTGTGTNGPGSDDSQVSAPIGFSFPFYGTNYTNVNIVSNGFLSFLPASATSYGQVLPNAAAPNAVIALGWEDLNPSAGQITYFNLTSPNRFVVNYNAVNFFFSTPGVTAQVILYEDGTIEMHNTSITATGFNTTTQGIENETGTLATVVPGRNDALFTATNEAWRFVPINALWSWSPTTYLDDATIPNPNAENMLTSETYTVTVTGAGGCTAQGSVAVTVNPLPVVDAGTYPTQCGLDAATDLPLVGSPAGGTFTGTGVSGAVGSQVFDPSVGTQTLTYTYFDGTCLNTDQVTITVEETDGDNDGIPDFCDECPLVYGQIGDFCNAGVGFDVVPGTLDASCNCVATPCTENILVDILTPDGSSNEASFEIYYEGTPTLACRGGFPAFPSGISNPIVTNCCLPQGCYKLFVYDSAGDGFASGGYEVREAGANGRRIIDNSGNFSSGSVSTINNSQSFCLPIGDIDLIYHNCDKLDWVDNQYLVCHADPAVSAVWVPGGANNVQSGGTGYAFWIFDPNGTYSFRRFRAHNASDGFSPAGPNRAAHMKINGWNNTALTPHIPANVLMNVRVRPVVLGSLGVWGPACTMMIDPARAACPAVWLQDDPTNPSDFSCGVMRSFGGPNASANKIVAKPPQFQPAPLAGGTSLRYQFRFRIEGEQVCIVRPPQTSPTMFLNWTTGTPLECSKTYEVDVRVSKDGGATWCVDSPNPDCYPNPIVEWGRMCTVTISCTTVDGGGSQSLATNGNLTMYPNPNRGDQLYLSLTQIEADVHTVSVDIYDLSGKRVTARTIAVQDGYLNTALELNGDLAGGMYMVNITAGDKTYTERLVITP